jgi:uncharacterized protein (DUF2267 family)
MLIIQKQPAQKLTNQQQAFNRNVKRLEALQNDIVRLTEKLDGTLTDYKNVALPLLEEKRSASRNLLVLLFGFLHRPNNLRPREKRALKGFMQNVMNDYLNFNMIEPDAEIKKIFLAIFGSTFDQVKKEAFDEVKMNMQSMFDEMGVDVNIEDFNQSMSDEEMAKRMHEMKSKKLDQEAEERQHAATSTKKESKRQLKERLAKEAQDKSISTIYKGLAKILHPDMERDESKKQEKEELMKEVTSAYKNKDLHTLLKLELRVIHSDEPHLEKLSNEKIKAYNDLLHQQIEEIEFQREHLPQHPRYSPLLQFVEAPYQLFKLNLLQTVEEIKRTLKGTQEGLAIFQGNEKNADAELRSMLKVWEHAEKKARQKESDMMRYMDW